MYIQKNLYQKIQSFRKKSNILYTSHVAGALHFSYKNIREMMMNDIKNFKRYATYTFTTAEPDKAIMRRDR